MPTLSTYQTSVSAEYSHSLGFVNKVVDSKFLAKTTLKKDYTQGSPSLLF